MEVLVERQQVEVPFYQGRGNGCSHEEGRRVSCDTALPHLLWNRFLRVLEIQLQAHLPGLIPRRHCSRRVKAPGAAKPA
jgi:hypothetical protein